jgi:hypothetical protein
MKILKSISLTLIASVISTSSSADLIERLGGLAYYDNVADLTWLTDANATGTAMYWDDASSWAAGLDVAGVTGWRLPDADTCFGYNCTGSEMGNLFYNVLGGSAGSPISTTHNANYEVFINLQDGSYWSGAEIAGSTCCAGMFMFNSGYQSTLNKSNSLLAWAVHSGDVSAVPVPASALLFGSGLFGLIAMARRSKV